MTKPVRSLQRGFSLMRALNRQNGANARALAEATKLSRGAVYRLLETMVLEGYVRNDGGRYFLQPLALTLVNSVQFQEWIVAIGQGVIEELGRDVLWPISLMTPSGLTMQASASTDHLSPFKFDVPPLGLRIPMMTSASGQAYLAFSPEGHRNMFIELLASEAPFPEDKALCQDRAQAQRILRSVKAAGAAMVETKHRVTILAVPVVDAEQVLGSVSLRFFTSSVPAQEAFPRYLKRMQEAAALIVARKHGRPDVAVTGSRPADH